METTAETKSVPKTTTFGFSEETQRRIVAMLLFDQAAWPEAGELIKPEHFENHTLTDSVKLIKDFYAKYKRPPTPDEFMEEFVLFLETTKRILPPEAYLEYAENLLREELNPDFSYVRDRVIEFVKRQAIKNAVLASINILQKEQDVNGIKALIDEATSIGPSSSELDVVDLADVERKEVRWFWQHKIPRAKLSLIVGDPGTGKSWFTMFLAAAVTTGAPLPHSNCRTEQGRVLILSAEDDPDDTIVPRFEDCGGNKEFAHVIQGTKKGRMFNLVEDLDRLKDLLRAKGDVRLVIIDPISAYFGAGGKINSHKDTDVRGILSPVVKLAKEQDVTIIGVMHLNKSQDLGPMYRVSGSMAFVAQARAVWLMTQEEREGEDKSLHYFTPIKVNLSRVPCGLVWKIDDETKNLEFLEPTFQPPSIKEQLGPRLPERPSKLDEAMRWLKDLLKDGTAIEQAEIGRRAAEEGIARTTLDRAKLALGVESRKGSGGNAPWTWVLPITPPTE